MSREPRAEASSLDYAEAKLTFNSVETIPNLNASAAFQVDSGKVFKEDTDIVPVIVDDTLSYVPWGGDNALPYNILELIESDETLSTCQMFNAEVCYGSGLEYNTDECGPAVKQQVEDFLLDNALPSYFLGVCQDFKHFAFTARREQQKRIVREKQQILDFLTGVENAGKVWFSTFYVAPPIFENKKNYHGYFF